MQPYAMNYYLVIGVQRPPYLSGEDGDSYHAFEVDVSSEKELTFKELEKHFEEAVKNLWNFIFEHLDDEEELKDWLDGEGYKNLDYVLVSSDPFPEVDIYGTDLANTYLGS